MRLWSLHPRYLDRAGIVAVWREGLLARAVLRGNTKGYKNHPQLVRFKQHPEPLRAIDHYLSGILTESQARGYRFDSTKIEPTSNSRPMPVTRGQMEYEVQHLLRKLDRRSQPDYARLIGINDFEPHPIFFVVPGEVEEWEKR
jgi:hypothetical protein